MPPVRWPVSRSEAARDITRGWHGGWQAADGAGDASTDPGDNRCLYPLILNSGRIRDQWQHHDPYRRGAAADAAYRGANGGGGAAGCRSLSASR
ncbi:hypothetical protein LNQ03_27565 [Klebsiella pneumoniae subsp. pneumoniae]|nr:hypothetical protein [Klebsiella pneumoniae subsp. pneumoniae]